MGYRNDLEAAGHRVTALQGENEQLRQQVETLTVNERALRQQLAAAERELSRLRPAAAPGSLTDVPLVERPVVRLWVAASILSTAIAGSQSESLGMQASQIAAIPIGYLAGAALAKGQSPWRKRCAGLGGALAVFALLAAFYATVWRAL